MGTGPVPPGLTEAFLGGAREASLRKRQPQARLADWRPGQHVRAKISEGCFTKGNLPRPGLCESVLPSLPASRETRLRWPLPRLGRGCCGEGEGMVLVPRGCDGIKAQLSDARALKLAHIDILRNHFCTAKELTEEIRSLTSEREGLEGLLHRLLVLSSRNVQKLGSVKEDYSSLRRELDQGKTAYGQSFVFAKYVTRDCAFEP
ncbi:hypothetical protein J1605_005764 [Eschrichtius robustus]|uniref:Uncharacterized protein n=1 Tax=Eschrichtius robustus TaxID=9764 RepID=A0AB34H6P8_ESCRO|nr:hypothetical protein J1605_005764 [Eschrichtius robustus]